MKHLRFILWILITLFIVILLVQNREALSTEVILKVDILYLQIESTRTAFYFILTIAFLFGVFITGLYGIIERFRLKKQIKELLSTTREKDKELNSLRNLPITADDVTTVQTTEPFVENDKEEI